MEPRQRADGTVEFARPAGGPVVFTLPRPVMYDGRKDPASALGFASSERVTQRVEQRGAETTITVTPDLAWLQSSARQYPVVVDPTVKIEPTIPDAQGTTTTRPACTSTCRRPATPTPPGRGR